MENRIQAEQVCLNCAGPVTGKFCANCGQSTRGLRLSLWSLFREFTEEIFAVDSKLVKTLLPLFFRPGLLTVSFIQGKRVRYLRPVKMYLFFSVVFFLAISLTEPNFEEMAENGNINITANGGVAGEFHEALEDLGQEGVISEKALAEIEDKLAKAKVRAALEKQPNEAKPAEEVTETKTPILAGDEKGKPALPGESKNKPIMAERGFWEKFEDYAADQEAKFEGMGEAEALQRFYPDFMKYVSWALFLLMPVFALFLKLLYIRRDPLYLDHLIFAFHFHSFLFIFFSTLVVLNALIPGDLEAAQAILIGLITPYYLFRSMRRVYEQGRLKSFAKFVFLGMLYSFSLTLAALFSLAITFLLA